VVNEEMFKARTRALAVEAVKIVDGLPRSAGGDVLGRQFLRSATSIGANYRAGCRGKSAADMVAKLSIVEEEADETLYWLDLMTATGMIATDAVAAVSRETGEILAMTVASIKTLRSRASNPKSKIQNPK